MTDLERLRDALYRKGSSEKWWLEAIDTHLKEDAEKERLQKALPSYYEQQAKRLEAELTEAKEAAVGFMAERDGLEAELSRLRAQYPETIRAEYEAELIELREALKEAEADLDDARAERDLAFDARDNWRRDHDRLQAELTELREAVREHLYRHHREGGATRLRQLIEEVT